MTDITPIASGLLVDPTTMSVTAGNRLAVNTALPREITATTGTLLPTDVNGVVCTNASGCTLTVNTHSPNAAIVIQDTNAGTVTIAASGVTNDGTLTTTNGADTWLGIVFKRAGHFIIGGNAA